MSEDSDKGDGAQRRAENNAFVLFKTAARDLMAAQKSYEAAQIAYRDAVKALSDEAVKETP